jgi:hypothetical protein
VRDEGRGGSQQGEGFVHEGLQSRTGALSGAAMKPP